MTLITGIPPLGPPRGAPAADAPSGASLQPKTPVNAT